MINSTLYHFRLQHKRFLSLRQIRRKQTQGFVLYIKYGAKLGYKSAVVRTPDNDIFVILLFLAKTIGLTIFLGIGTGKHGQIVNVSQMTESVSADKCKMVLGLYVFTGEDVTSSFKGKGKIGPLI